MSSKTTQTVKNDYNAASMGAFNEMQGPLKNVLLDSMKDPLKSSYFTNQVQMMQKQNQGLLATSMANILNNGRMNGLRANSPLMQSLIARQQRASSANANNAFLNALMNAQQRQMWATSQAQAYNPLQTGETKTVKKSGLGTWLPQAIGIGLAAAAAPFTGGASLAAIPGMAGGLGGGGATGGMGTGEGLNTGGSPFGAGFSLGGNPFDQYTKGA